MHLQGCGVDSQVSAYALLVLGILFMLMELIEGACDGAYSSAMMGTTA
jgi:hypothetical protein